MISAGDVYDSLRAHGVTFFTGVPDSALAALCAHIDRHTSALQHVIAANEGAAVALAAGHHLGSGGLPVVYLQNSGLGNAVNPLLSLADAEVYSLPVILIIGWRGEPSLRDEPQHIKQGRVMLAMLDAMELPYRVLSIDQAGALADVEWAVNSARTRSQPIALIVRKGTFAPLEAEKTARTTRESLIGREHAIEIILDALGARDAVVSTTGMISRELYETRVRRREMPRDFLVVGSMGHASATACSIALVQPDRQLFCLDGDGAFLMHMGSIAVQGQSRARNFKHIVLNNGCHDSVGGQPTVAFECDLTGIARSCGYTTLDAVSTAPEIAASVAQLRMTDGPALLEIRVSPGARADLGRPASSPRENKEAFVRFLSAR